MKMLDEPNFSLIDIYPEAVNHYRESSKKMLIKSIEEKLINDELDYKEKLKTNNLYLLKKKETHDKRISIKELTNLYEKKLKNKSYFIRKYYDQILLSSSLCPFCGKRHSRTVDHFLSKSVYPNFSITPINLIPCCSDCNFNKGKQDDKLDCLEDQFFHPYNENINCFSWLECKVKIDGLNIYFIFNVKKIKDNITYQRLCNQFKVLKLRNYYAEEAGLLFSRERNFYCYLFAGGKGKEELKSHFEMELFKGSLNKDNLNLFEVVYYKALLLYFELVVTIL